MSSRARKGLIAVAALAALALLSTVLVRQKVKAQGVITSSLMFQYVTNTAGYDTGIVISNTTADPFGTLNAAGKCSLSFYGSQSVPVYATPSIAAGKQFTTLASTIAPGFQGYVISVCNFPFSQGVAIFGDVGFRNFSTAIPAASLNRGIGGASVLN